MVSGASQPDSGSPSVVNAETNSFGVGLHHANGLNKAPDERSPLLARSQEQPRDDDGDASEVAQADNGSDDAQKPKGIRFAVLYTCLLLGCFFVGYVRFGAFTREEMRLTTRCRIPAVLQH